MNVFRIAAICVAVLLAACASPPAAVPSAAPAAPAAAQPVVTGTFPIRLRGEEPAEDGTTVAWKIDLHAEGSFAMRVGRDDGYAPSDDIGRWTLAPGGQAMVLSGSRGDTVTLRSMGGGRFRPLAGGKLRDEGDARWGLRPNPSADAIIAHLPVRAMYAPPGGITECATGRRFRIVEAEFGLKEATSRVAMGPQGVLVGFEALVGFITNSGEPAIRVLREPAVWPGETCATKR